MISKMKLEMLPNELLLDLFEYFDCIYLLRSFFGYNNRFNQLIYIYLQTHQLNLEFISKDNFDLISQKYLSSLTHHIISLRLSNEQTPNLSNLLFSSNFTIDNFFYLQSLYLHYIPSLDILIEITYYCKNLIYLTDLTIIKCNINEKLKNCINLFHNIWNIPKLSYCNLDGIELKCFSLSFMSKISLTIKKLFIENISCDLSYLFCILNCTPNLEQLSTTIYSYSTNTNLDAIIESMKSLKIYYQGSIDSLKTILSQMPNLTHLKIETLDLIMDGNVWKQILNDYLFKIEIFQLKMKLEFEGNDTDVENSVNQLLDSFNTRFWIEEHQWYVRCDWELSEITTYAFLYTLPYAFKTIYYLNECNTKSTCDDEEKYRSYKCVEMFENSYRKSMLLHNFNLVCDKFPNLRSLDVVLPFENHFNSHNIILNQLTSLTARIQIASAYDQLQILFNRAPRLYSLRIIFWRKFSNKLFQLTSKTIRRVELGGMFSWCNEFTKDECIAFANSDLGHQCEVLSIEIENRNSVINLIEGMSNLRLLNFRSRDDRWDYRKIPSTENELIHWVQNHFSFTYEIIRNVEKPTSIQVWIDQQERKTKRDTKISKSGHKVSKVVSSVQKFFAKR
ncbi:unnamed protein product [Adineta steineri]|uniref:F-box domain-containing protein n=1 Tax=Adineta steineri TaxID=433720 RepID=A0A819KW02_9BILA|nr:unnamed protein product [Adineta steineri]CAF3951390.1 unnamed protein product [Adineta steineri]